LQEYLDDIYIAYINDVLIYTCSDNEANYEVDVVKVLTKIRDARLYLNFSKCKFKVKRVKYLSFILTIEGIKIDLKKVSIVLN